VAADTGCNVVAVDNSVPALELARRRSLRNVRGVAADATALLLADRTFDAALILDSVASLSDPAGVLRELARVLRPRAKLAFTAEIGLPLDGTERAMFARTVAPTMCTLDDWLALLQATGFVAKVVYERTPAAAQIVATLARDMRTHQQSLQRELGDTPVTDLAATLEAWSRLFECARIAEVAIIAQLRTRARRTEGSVALRSRPLT
jgi:ubiquinone/menaquinone biosynthesis C-methylase UbiE